VAADRPLGASFAGETWHATIRDGVDLFLAVDDDKALALVSTFEFVGDDVNRLDAPV